MKSNQEILIQNDYDLGEKYLISTAKMSELMDLARIEERKEQEDLLDECRLQLEYLNNKFGETGTTNALLSKLNILNK